MNAVEVEVKVRALHESVRESALSAGFEATGAVEQHDEYFDAPDRSFAETDEALRIRCESADNGERSATLTYKGPRLGTQTKSRVEHRCPLREPEAMRTILELLGYTSVNTVVKRRERLERDDIVIALDAVDEIGAFVEVELVGRRSERASLESHLESILTELGLAAAPREDRTYLEILLEHD